ncbi:hypothetical protein PanWU01x14_310500 [Parasponia andersonii]|uniref:Uncharacterized protein n=1 Tax=Parasponia andersonii TaxID=3476 RepID=A0A2P5AQ90_PARAD|nr:hypothetical protein PanWU01x14_310500 [Parasponia andersonii]
MRSGRSEKFWKMYINAHPISEIVIFLSCVKPVHNSSYIDTAPCINTSAFSKNPEAQYTYVVYGTGFRYSDLADTCKVDQASLVSSRKGSEEDKKRKLITTSYQDVHDELVYGFELSWLRAFQNDVKRDFCYVDEESNEVVCTTKGRKATGPRFFWNWKAIAVHILRPVFTPVAEFVHSRFENIGKTFLF